MISILREEFSGLLTARAEPLSSVLSVRAVNDRVDSLTLFCRELLRSSSLCLVDGDLHVFDGRSYVSCSRADVVAVLGNVLVDGGVSPTDVRRMSDMPMSVIGERSFRSGRLLCFQNGVYDLDDGSFAEGFSADRVCTERMEYRYDPSAGCAAWEAFLCEVLPDASVRSVLQEFFGMVFLDRERLSVEKFALMVGSGANGKSVIGNVMRRVLGATGVTSLDTAQLRDEKMLPFIGKRLNFVPDMARNKDFDSAIKALASGQEVTARRNYQDPERVKCPPLCFALNELPVFRDLTPAFFRRLLLFRFDVQIPTERQDRTLADRLCATDLPGIFNWVIAGRDRLILNGGEFTPCPKMDGELESMRREVSACSYPARAYLESRGYSVRPEFDGQTPVLVSQNEIALGLRDTVSRYMITAELKRLGVQTFRSKELFYKVYPKTK